MPRLDLTVENAVITRVSSKVRAGEDKESLVAIVVEVPEKTLDEVDIGRLHKARGRTLTISVSDPQLELALGPDNGRAR